MIRRAEPKDYVRIGEITVFNNRLFYYPIFQDAEYSFQIFTVDYVIQELINNEYQDYTYVLEDEGIVRGYVIVKDGQIIKCYVDSFFQNKGYGGVLLEYAIHQLRGKCLFVLEKNKRAISFYEAHGFVKSGRKQLEEGTSEYLLEFVLN